MSVRSSMSEPPCCPYCGQANGSSVIDKRGSWRRRECHNPECAMRFSTDEIVRRVANTRQPKHRIPRALQQPSLI